MGSAWRIRKTFQTDVSPTADYAAFDQLDGRHPLQNQVPEGQVSYRVRELETGKVVYFNFNLAKEMGLISSSHPAKLTKQLEAKLLQTFCIRIINEYDEAHHIQYPSHLIKPNPYMATRYLQLQHRDKTGRTSGDGRSVWNGVVRHKGVIWDVSSRGTGVTQLSPGFVEAGRPLRSGNTLFGYGCGLADLDELMGSALLSEIFFHNGIATERVLCVIDLGKGAGIGVRASQNLMRPAHFFSFLKQGKLEPLRRMVDYFIARQKANGNWVVASQSRHPYDQLLQWTCTKFARFAAMLEREYIFAWLDWDGDNVLADAGIIDYGSIRQFGLRHDQYRYDDVDRFSTSLNEQQSRARLIVQVYAQMVDFLRRGQRRPLKHFARHPILKEFDRQFEEFKCKYFLFQLGFSEADASFLTERSELRVKRCLALYTQLETLKTSRAQRTVADGINRPAILNMRKLNEMLPEVLLDPRITEKPYPLLKAILSESASSRDRHKIKQVRVQNQMRSLLRSVRGLIELVGSHQPERSVVEVYEIIGKRVRMLYQMPRITGNALIHIVYEILNHRKKRLSDQQIQKVMDMLIASQCVSPDRRKPEAPPTHLKLEETDRLMRAIDDLLWRFREDI